MTSAQNHPKILLVDDDERLLRSLTRTLRGYDVKTACNSEEAYQFLKKDTFAVVISDQHMAGRDGLSLLSALEESAPTTTRMMLTGDTAPQMVLDALNKGRLFRFLEKPCAPEVLQKALEEGVQHHKRLMAEKDLLERTLAGSVKVLTDMLSVFHPEAFAKTNTMRPLVLALAEKMGLKKRWEVEIAVMLYPLAEALCPLEALEKKKKGAPLTKEELATLESAPLLAKDLIRNIPRLENLSEAIYYSRKGFDGSGVPLDGRKGKDLPLLSRILKIAADLQSLENTLSLKALSVLEQTPSLYDEGLLRLTREVLSEVKETHLTSPLDSLQEGDVLAEDLQTLKGELLLKKGFALTALTLKRLSSLKDHLTLPPAITILRQL